MEPGNTVPQTRMQVFQGLFELRQHGQTKTSDQRWCSSMWGSATLREPCCALGPAMDLFTHGSHHIAHWWYQACPL